MAKKNGNNVAVLAFLGSLIYLYVLFNWANVGVYGYAAWMAADLWLPLLAAAATIGAIGLFLVSLISLTGMPMPGMIFKSALWGGFALFALTIGGPWFWWVIVGFFLAMVGAKPQM